MTIHLGHDSNRQSSGIYKNDENSKVKVTENEAAVRALAEAKRLQEKQQRDKEQQERDRERRLTDLETAKTRLEDETTDLREKVKKLNGETIDLREKVKKLDGEKMTLGTQLKLAEKATRDMKDKKDRELETLKETYAKENPSYPYEKNLPLLWDRRCIYLISLNTGRALDAGALPANPLPPLSRCISESNRMISDSFTRKEED